MKLLIRASSAKATHKTPVMLETSTCLQSTAPVGFRLHTLQFCRCLYIFFMTSYLETVDINVASWFLSWPCGCTQNRIANTEKRISIRPSSVYQVHAPTCWAKFHGHILFGRLTTSVVPRCQGIQGPREVFWLEKIPPVRLASPPSPPSPESSPQHATTIMTIRSIKKLSIRHRHRHHHRRRLRLFLLQSCCCWSRFSAVLVSRTMPSAKAKHIKSTKAIKAEERKWIMFMNHI